MEDVNIGLYFDPVEIPNLYAPYMNENDSLKASLTTGDDYDVAIIGVKNDTQSIVNTGCALAPNAIRKYLYPLRGGWRSIKVRDLGNLKDGQNPNDQLFALSAVIESLARKNIHVIVIGGSQDLTATIYDGLRKCRHELNVTLIDSRIDLGEDKEKERPNNYIRKIIKDKQLQMMDVLAFQGYYISDSQFNLLYKENHIDPKYRLGQLRYKPLMAEPIFRDTDLLSIDINAVRQADAPGCGNPSPNGLYGEDLCQLMHLSGSSDRMSVMGFFEVNPSLDRNDQTVQLAAQAIWHHLEALDNRVCDYPKCQVDKYKNYIIPCSDGYNMNFYYSDLRKRWWIRIPMEDEERIISCTKEDFDSAKSGKVPDIWMRHFMK